MYQMYGIPNCDTVKKAIKALEAKKIEFEFINFKKTPPTSAQIKVWKESLGEYPVNTKGPTYRKIKEEFEAATASQKIKLLIENTSAIKRPILEKNGKMIAIGFDADKYTALK